MKNADIIKQSLLFPIRYYKHFIIVALLFLISELIEEHITHAHADGNIILMFIAVILPLIALGINLQIIFYAIKDNKGFPKISLKKSLDESVKDTILESYYLAITLIITIIISAIIGLLQGIFDISRYSSHIMVAFEDSSVIEIIGAAPNVFINNSTDIILTTLLIFIIMLTIMFSFCTISKIDLEVNHNFGQIFDFRYIWRLIRKIGITKYLKFLVLVMILCIVIANIISFLNFKQVLGSLLSALLEAFTLFFFLYAFTQLYPE